MKCEVVRDLIPLYDEKLCSAESAALVEEHIKTCDACKALLQKLPEVIIPETDENAIKPFVKVKRKLRARVAALIVLGIVLLAVLIPVGYLTINQIFHISGGTDFTDLILKHEMREFAEMIVDGRMEEYTQRYERFYLGDAPDGTSVNYRSFYLEKLNAAYERVKKYDPRIGEIHSHYHKFKDGDSIRDTYFRLDFTLSDGTGHSVTVFPGNYDGQGYGIGDWEDPVFLIALPELGHEKSYYEAYSAISADDIPTDRREIAEFINLLYLGDGGDYQLNIVNSHLQKKTTEPLPRADNDDPESYVDLLANLLAIRFEHSDYCAVYNGYADFIRSNYTLETAIGARQFDTERMMFCYPVIMIGSDGENTAGVSIKLYYDERGFHSPRAEDISGVTGGSDLEMKLAKILG